MGLFLCSPHMSLGRYCQKNVVKGGSLEKKKQVKGEMVRGWLSIEGGGGSKLRPNMDVTKQHLHKVLTI